MSEETSVFGLRVSSNARSWTVRLLGQLDVAQSAMLVDAAMALRQCDLAAVSFDLGEVTFVDTAGYRALLHAAAIITAGGAEVRITRQSPALQRLQSLWALTAA